MSRHKLKSYPLRLREEVRRGAEEQAKKKRWSLNTWLEVAAEEKLERDAGRVAQ